MAAMSHNLITLATVRGFRGSAALAAIALAVLPVLAARGSTFPLPPADVDLVGAVEVVELQAADTLSDVAREYGMGFEEMRLANPRVDAWLPGAATLAKVPGRFVLPDAPREGLVLNVPEMRLYHYPKPRKGEGAVVVTHPVSIGRMDWSTPMGTTRIAARVRAPSWRPPASIKAEAAARGEPLPDVIPPGPDNPLGGFALRLGLPGYLIHSTNKPYGVGMRVTHGCVRMYPEDIAGLFERVAVGTRVHIVNQPVKAGWAAGTLYLEVHPPLEEEDVDLLRAALDAIRRATEGRPTTISGSAVKAAVAEPNGIPVAVSR
jgi:L,D-transpeptidase ErfK/SrfK